MIQFVGFNRAKPSQLTNYARHIWQRKTPKRLINEIANVKPKEEKKLKALDNTLYDVVIKEVDGIGKRVKIHFKGYCKRIMNENRSMKTIC